MIEHLLYTQNVIGLNPIPPTILIGHKCYGSIHDLGSCGVSSILTWPTNFIRLIGRYKLAASVLKTEFVERRRSGQYGHQPPF